jgi:hypothetical protein
MKRSLFPTLLLLLSLFFLSGCAYFSSFQTAKTLPKNSGEVYGALNLAGTQLDFGEEISDTNNVGVFLPIIELGGRYGLADRLDLGLKVSTSLNAIVDAKYQFLGDQESPFAMALGGGIGFWGVVGENSLLQLQVPLHASYHPSQNFALYVTPRYVNQFLLGGDGSINYLGFSAGLEAGNKIRFGGEVSYSKIMNEGNQEFFDIFNFWQVGLGVKFRFGSDE